MTHTADTLMALADAYAEVSAGSTTAHAVEMQEALRTALTEALAQQVGFNGLTEAETAATMSVMGLSATKAAQTVREQDAALLRKTLDVLNGAEQMNPARHDKFEIELTAEQIDSLATEIRARLNGAQPVREPSPGACKTCGNEYLASRTDVYKDKRPFIYCDCCGAMADSKTWYLTHGIGDKT